MKSHICKNNTKTPLLRKTSKKLRACKLAYEVLTAKNFPALAIAVFCLFFVASCGLITRNFAPAPADNSNAVDSNSSNANGLQSATYDREKFQKLLDAGHDLEKMSLPVKLDPKPMLKGKVYVFTNLEASRGKGYDDGISMSRKASSLDELQTAIRINCRKGKSLGDFQNNSNGIDRHIKGYAVECEVALIDYPSRIILDKKNFSNNESQEVITNRETIAGDYLNQPPVGEISRYIDSLPVDKMIPGMLSLDEKELIRLPTIISLKPEAALKGKIKLARQYDDGDFNQGAVKIDAYTESSLPFSKITTKPEELETLIKIVCGKGDKIGQFGKTTQYSNRCEISVIDYKTLTVIAQKVVENKTVDDNSSAKDSSVKNWVTKLPKQEIEDYLKSLPQS